jgi:hypothetical protein
VFIFRCLECDAVNGTRRGAEITGHATLLSVGIAGQNDPSPPPRRNGGLLFGIEDRRPPPECVQEHGPYGFDQAKHKALFDRLLKKSFGRLCERSEAISYFITDSKIEIAASLRSSQ